MLNQKNSIQKEIKFRTLASNLKRPDLYEEGNLQIWRDEHISKGMLEAHLSEDTDAASRSTAFIDRSVDFICEIAPVASYPKLLDLGCGPGLYSERFKIKGYEVVAMDFSERSIQYAKTHALERGLDIDYICSNYLEAELEATFDVITLIYCDFGALKVDEQRTLLENINKWLKPGGILIFDVLTKYQFEDHENTPSWHLQEGSGFWRPHSYICMSQLFDYETDIKLFQYVIIDEQEALNIARVWTHYFSKASIKERLNAFQYGQIEFYSDVTGKPFEEDSKTLCVVIRK